MIDENDRKSLILICGVIFLFGMFLGVLFCYFLMPQIHYTVNVPSNLNITLDYGNNVINLLGALK